MSPPGQNHDGLPHFPRYDAGPLRFNWKVVGTGLFGLFCLSLVVGGVCMWHGVMPKIQFDKIPNIHKN
jgi:hypothetical protein